MKQKTYVPNPVNTAGVELTQDMIPLVEQMAKNVHDVWAKSRIKDGWKYGATRDDKAKTHPCLVSYEDLPDSEKAYDRDTAVETLKLIMKLGFSIVHNKA